MNVTLIFQYNSNTHLYNKNNNANFVIGIVICLLIIMDTFKPLLTKLALTNFRRFSQWELAHIPSPLVLIGDNGCGKTTILWALVLFFRGFNALLSNKMTPNKVLD